MSQRQICWFFNSHSIIGIALNIVKLYCKFSFLFAFCHEYSTAGFYRVVYVLLRLRSIKSLNSDICFSECKLKLKMASYMDCIKDTEER